MVGTMRLTPAQRKAVKYDNNALIVACPGSGKTRTLVAKLLHCLDEVRDTSRKIACLTYTNAAVHEIESRLRQYGKCGDEEYCDVATIHSFCLGNVLSSFYFRIPEYVDGFTVITPESDEYQKIANDVLAEYGLASRFREYFESFNREPNGRPIVPPDIDIEIAFSFWDRMQAKGFVDFPNIIYYSLRLLREKPSIAYALSCKYAWFLVDEFQDTSALQVDIFRKIAEVGHSKFFLVGDPCQSIYGFAGARVDLMESFAEEVSANNTFKLLANYRSSNLIIDHAEKLIPRIPRMYGAGDTANIGIRPIYIHTATALEAIIDYFLPAIAELGISYGETAILAPWWVKLLPLGRGLRDYGIPVVGPGSRPYRRSHIFAALAEQVCAFINHPTNNTFHRIERELFLLVNGITGKRPYQIFSYHGNVTIRKLVSAGSSLCDDDLSATNWLLAASDAFEGILKGDGIIPSSCENILCESAKCIIEEMKRNKVDISNLSVADLGLFANTENNIHLLTMHGAKGREYDAVAIIDLHDGRVPDFRAINNCDMDRIEESKRLLYVSITRARRFLMYVTDEEDARINPSRFICREHLDLSKIN